MKQTLIRSIVINVDMIPPEKQKQKKPDTENALDRKAEERRKTKTENKVNRQVLKSHNKMAELNKQKIHSAFIIDLTLSRLRQTQRAQPPQVAVADTKTQSDTQQDGLQKEKLGRQQRRR